VGRVHENVEVGLFGTATRTKVLLAIHLLRDTYPSQLARLLGISLNQAQLAVLSLERAGIVVLRSEGNQRRVMINPRLDEMSLSDRELLERLQMRRRPRLTGKEL
jgi:DNA-binding transcriptional ArsR family regulator